MKRKTKKTVSKRFKETSKGKIIRGHAYSSHLKRKKTKRRIRRQKEPSIVSKGFAKSIKSMIGK
jgi:large subunit ribosomal protein L35